MKVTFLGTGTSTGIPLIGCHCEVCTSENVKDKRLRTSALIQVDGKNIVIDCGSDFRQQMLREQVKVLDAVLMTHGHRDHTGGIDDIRAYNFILQRNIDFYLNQSTKDILLKHFDYAFDESNKYPSKPKLALHLIDHKPFELFGLSIIPIEVMHATMPVLGFRIGNFTYITDANYISPEEKEKIKGTKVLVLNALRHKPHPSHFTIDEAIALAQEVQAEKTYLTHITHQLGLHDVINKTLPENIFLAYDGLNIEV